METEKFIGKFIQQEDGTIDFYKAEKEKYTFRKDNSWGINLKCYEKTTGKIIVRTEIGTYSISKDEADQIKTIREWKNNQTEPHAHIPKEKFSFSSI